MEVCALHVNIMKVFYDSLVQHIGSKNLHTENTWIAISQQRAYREQYFRNCQRWTPTIFKNIQAYLALKENFRKSFTYKTKCGSKAKVVCTRFNVMIFDS